MAADHAPKPNAFLHPSNPGAVFPQLKKPDIIDLRLHKIKDGGLAASGVFRKHLSKNAKQSPYSIVNQPAHDQQDNSEQMSDSDSVEVNHPVAQKKAQTTVADLTTMTASLKIGKKQPKIDDDNEMRGLNQKSKGIKKAGKSRNCKKLRKQLGF
jgi:lipopolysaccharide export LptBFGC system permease protein LptF